MDKLRHFQIHFFRIFIILVLLFGAYDISRTWISLEDWFLDSGTVEAHVEWVAAADIGLALLFIVFLIYAFKLQIFKNPFHKRTLLVFALGLILTFGLILLRSFLDQEQQLSIASAFPTLSDLYTQFPIFWWIYLIFTRSIIHELIFRGLFFKYFLKDDEKLSPILLILGSSLIYPLLVMMDLGYFTFFDIAFYFLSELLLASSMYFSRDIKVPIILRLCLSLIHFY